MATRRQYGTTWWGAQWLSALERVDNANRLPRGKTYANTGRVVRTELMRDPPAVEALVDGSSYYPYEVKIAMPPVATRSAKRLAEAIAADPDLIASLMDGEIPSKIADICYRLNIELFPKSWRSMKLSCSCPDSARVCKHIAAVFYIMADRVDLDPFFIFKFRGLDLKKELLSLGIDIDSAVGIKPFSPAELLESAAEGAADLHVQPASEGTLPAQNDPEARAKAEDAALSRLRSIPYGTLPILIDTVTQLIPQKSALSSNKDLSAYAKQILSRASREAVRALQSSFALETLALRKADAAADEEASASEASPAKAWKDFLLQAVQGAARSAWEALLPEAAASASPVLTLKRNGLDLRVTIPFPAGFTPAGTKKPGALEIDPDIFFPGILGTLSAREAQELSPEIECWREAAAFAAHLSSHSSIIPAVITSDAVKSPCPRVWWLPAMRDASVRKAAAEFAAGIAPWAAKLVKVPAACREDGESDPMKAALLMASAGLTGFIRASIFSWSSFNGASDLAEAALTCTDVSQLDGRITAEAGERLARLFKPFSLGSAYPWRPVLTVRTGRDGNVGLNFGILGRGADIAAAARRALEEPEEAEADPPALEQQAAECPVPSDRPLLMKRILSEPRWAPHRFAALTILKTIAQACPELEEIRSNRGKPATLPSENLKDFLFTAAPLLSMLGITVMMSEKLRRLLRPRLIGFAAPGQNLAKSLLTKDAIADFSWSAAIGGKTLTRKEFLALADKAGQVVQFEDSFVYLDPNEIERIRRTLERPPAMTPLERVRAALTSEFEGAEVKVSSELGDALRRLSEVTDVPVPEGLNAKLRPYQERGYSWLMKNSRLGLGSLIADDMGLGKTLQVISAVLALKNQGELSRHRAIAVLPATLIANWQREIAKFAPSLTCGVHHGADRKLPEPDKLPDITLTSYGTLRRDFEALSAIRWRLLILDEAQAIKNPSAAQTAAVRGLKASQVIAMTGTPVENRLMEYWSILSAAQPRLLGSAKDFEQTFARPIESNHDEAAAEAFRKLTAPFMLRRVKTDKSIIADLPEKHVIDSFSNMRPEQAALYEVTLEKELRHIQEAETAPDANTPEGRMARRGRVLRLITSLKQICNSPSQYLKTDAPVPDSGKGDALIEILSQCRDAGRKVLIFTQYREMGERLQDWIEHATGERPDFLHGGVPMKARTQMVDRFQEDRTARVFILSLKAGGTGLNLTAASAVIHYDLWWNPAVEAQATDRAFRIGQRRDVSVYRFITAGSFEERINEMLAHKRELADLTVTTGETWIGDLPAAELTALFGLEKAEKNSKASAGSD